MTQIEFINKINQAANEARKKGALFNKTVLFAQAALESNWGNSELAVKANNLFGIKTGSGWLGESIRLQSREWNDQTGWYLEESSWRKYQNWTECIMDYAAIIGRVSWFQDAIRFIDTPSLYLNALLAEGTQPGWATDPHYTRKIIKIAAMLEAYGGPKWY